MMIKQDGSLWATGTNWYGQLGDSSTTDKTSFEQIMSSGVVDVAAGISHTIVLMQYGSVWATGLNHYGQLGDGTINNRYSFAVVTSYGMAVAASGHQSMVLKQVDKPY